MPFSIKRVIIDKPGGKKVHGDIWKDTDEEYLDASTGVLARVYRSSSEATDRQAEIFSSQQCHFKPFKWYQESSDLTTEWPEQDLTSLLPSGMAGRDGCSSSCWMCMLRFWTPKDPAVFGLTPSAGAASAPVTSSSHSDVCMSSGCYSTLSSSSETCCSALLCWPVFSPSFSPKMLSKAWLTINLLFILACCKLEMWPLQVKWVKWPHMSGTVRLFFVFCSYTGQKIIPCSSHDWERRWLSHHKGHNFLMCVHFFCFVF